MKGRNYKKLTGLGFTKFVMSDRKQNKYIHTQKSIEDYKMNIESKSFIDTPVICKEFGCGKTLSPTERLYSDYCFKHQRLLNQQTIVNDKKL